MNRAFAGVHDIRGLTAKARGLTKAPKSIFRTILASIKIFFLKASLTVSDFMSASSLDHELKILE